MRRGICVLCVCGLAAAGCQDRSPPTRESLQAAYDRETAAGKPQHNSAPRHDPGLRLITAKCDDGASGRYLCQVSFVAKNDPAERLYFDIVAVARARDGWALLTALCKH